MDARKRRAASCRKSWATAHTWIGIFDTYACGTFHFLREQTRVPGNDLIPLFGATKKNRCFGKSAFRKKETQGPFKLWSKQTHSSFTPQVTPKKWLLLPRTCILQEYLDRVEAFANIFLSVPTAEVSKIAGENMALGCRDRMEIGDNQHLQRRTSVESLYLLGYHPVSMSSVILRKEEEIGD